MQDIPLMPYSQRKQRMGQCGRCYVTGVRVIESVQGGWLCWNLGTCTASRPLPKARPWTPPPVFTLVDTEIRA